MIAEIMWILQTIRNIPFSRMNSIEMRSLARQPESQPAKMYTNTHTHTNIIWPNVNIRCRCTTHYCSIVAGIENSIFYVCSLGIRAVLCFSSVKHILVTLLRDKFVRWFVQSTRFVCVCLFAGMRFNRWIITFKIISNCVQLFSIASSIPMFKAING